MTAQIARSFSSFQTSMCSVNVFRIQLRISKYLRFFRQFLRTCVRLGPLHALRAQRIFSYTSDEELCALYDFIRSRPIRTAVEIGSHLGKSSIFIASALPPGGTLFCVDTWYNDAMPGGYHDTFEQFLTNVQRLRKKVVAIRKASWQLQKSDLPASVDFCFIDGDHRYESVKKDINMVVPMIGTNGWLAFHDFASWAGVTLAVCELISTLEWKPVLLAKSIIVLQHSRLEPDEEKWLRLGCKSSAE